MSSSDNEFYDNPYNGEEFGYDPITQLSEENERLRDLIGVMIQELKLRLRHLNYCLPTPKNIPEVEQLVKLIIRAENALSVP
jgi:predicted aldo/keto reductase-like oxidoreductase